MGYSPGLRPRAERTDGPSTRQVQEEPPHARASTPRHRNDDPDARRWRQRGGAQLDRPLPRPRMGTAVQAPGVYSISPLDKPIREWTDGDLADLKAALDRCEEQARSRTAAQLWTIPVYRSIAELVREEQRSARHRGGSQAVRAGPSRTARGHATAPHRRRQAGGDRSADGPAARCGPAGRRNARPRRHARPRWPTS